MTRASAVCDPKVTAATTVVVPAATAVTVAAAPLPLTVAVAAFSLRQATAALGGVTEALSGAVAVRPFKSIVDAESVIVGAAGGGGVGPPSPPPPPQAEAISTTAGRQPKTDRKIDGAKRRIRGSVRKRVQPSTRENLVDWLIQTDCCSTIVTLRANSQGIPSFSASVRLAPVSHSHPRRIMETTRRTGALLGRVCAAVERAASISRIRCIRDARRPGGCEHGARDPSVVVLTSHRETPRSTATRFMLTRASKRH